MIETPLLIAGLGNPGAEYALSRHNTGFMVADALHEAFGFGPWRDKFQGLLSEGKLGGRKTYLIKPQTFMNASGNAVGPALRFYKLPLAALVVFHDEIDLAAGKMKAKTGGGDAGHNGLRSITAAVGPNYRRVRIGVGHPDRARVVSHVLQSFSKADGDWLNPALEAICQAAPLLARDDDVGFMNKVALILKPPAHKDDPNAPADKPKDTKAKEIKKERS